MVAQSLKLPQCARRIVPLKVWQRATAHKACEPPLAQAPRQAATSLLQLRWRRRLPLLDEDPRESELDRAPPGEEDGEPFGGLTPLGRRLVGLDEWPRVTAA